MGAGRCAGSGPRFMKNPRFPAVESAESGAVLTAFLSGGEEPFRRANL